MIICRSLILMTIIAGIFTVTGCLLSSSGTSSSDPATSQEITVPAAAEQASNQSRDLMIRARALFGRLPEEMPNGGQDSPALTALGAALFSEPALSADRQKSCAACHPLEARGGGTDNFPFSPAKGPLRNTPTVLNAGMQTYFGWEGQFTSLADQARAALLHPGRMGLSGQEEAAARLENLLPYPPAFAEAFPYDANPVTFDNLVEAIAAFGRTLITRDRFDLFLGGEEESLDNQERQGLEFFIELGCVRCHDGPLLGGTLLQRIGIHHPYHGGDNPPGEDETFVYKVPPLRNVTLTGPYFHDGRVATLPEAIARMAHLQLGRTLDSRQIDLILRFFTSLADIARITAPGMAVQFPIQPPLVDLSVLPASALETDILMGWQLINGAGPDPDAAAGEPLRPGLACRHCHIDSGTRPFALPWTGLARHYPAYDDRADRVLTLAERINDCRERNLNLPPLADDSPALQAMTSYLVWLDSEFPDDSGRGTAPLAIPERGANLMAGEEVFRRSCQSCHGADGQGYRSEAGDELFIVPPLWGEESFGEGSAMNRVLLLAAFVRGNMPPGTTWPRTSLTSEEAFDVAAYVNSYKRPERENLDRDYPDPVRKPVDYPHPPHAYGFSPLRHKYGPFPPIMEVRDKGRNATQQLP